MSYLSWLALTSVVFLVAERALTSREGRGRPLRLRDLGFLALNGHFFAVWTAALNAGAAIAAATALRSIGLAPRALATAWPLAVQILLLLVLRDFLQWCVHNLLHRVPWLWEFHKVHHSIQTMDWLGNWRFHWMEVLVYRSLLWLPLAWLGASGAAVMAVAVISTVWGDFNHARLDVGLGPAGYLLNSPRMHLWHHDASGEGGTVKNFGVIFSVWDYLFGTAYWPRERAPERLGYAGDAEMPQDLLGQLTWPVAKLTGGLLQ
jgi:sterol desaturase/sphingolipid hydroxylase (fatty acid hydroxylase superfamily)